MDEIDKDFTLNNENSNLKLSFVERFQLADFCERATCHGLNDLYRAQTLPSKLMWLLLLLLAYVAMTYQIYSEVQEYMKGPIITSISYEVMDEMPFPEVYVCPFHFIDWDYVDTCAHDKYRTTDELLRFLNLLSNNESKTLLTKKSTIIEVLITDKPFVSDDSNSKTLTSERPKFIHVLCPVVPQHETVQQFILRHAFSPRAFIRESSFQNQHLPTETIVTRKIDKEFGVCFSVDVNKFHNGSSLIRQNTPGSGLSIVIDLQNHIVTDSLPRVPRPTMDGALIRIASKIDPASIGGHLVQPGTWTKIQLSPKEVHLVEFANSVTPQKCVSFAKGKSQNLFHAFSNEISYTQPLCRYDCSLYLTYNTCSCVIPTDSTYMNRDIQTALKADRHTVFCNATQLSSCGSIAFSSTNADYNKCTNKCLRPCDFVEMDLTISQTSFPSSSKLKEAIIPVFRPRFDTNVTSYGLPFYSPYYYGSIDFDAETGRLRDNIIILDIAYHRMELVKYFQNPSRTVTSLLSNLGGQAGLWAGASVFTLLQLIAFGLHWSYSNLKCRTTSRL